MARWAKIRLPFYHGRPDAGLASDLAVSGTPAAAGFPSLAFRRRPPAGGCRKPFDVRLGTVIMLVGRG
jgi:hypothetical protein